MDSARTLLDALKAFDACDTNATDQRPRERALVAALLALAVHHGKRFEPTMVKRNGDIPLRIDNHGNFGRALAKAFGKVGTRKKGVFPREDWVKEDDNRCIIHIFEAERLLTMIKPEIEARCLKKVILREQDTADGIGL